MVEDLIILYFFILLVKFQDCEECLLRHFHVTDLLHALLALLLLLKQLTLSAHVTSITLRRNVLTNTLDSFTGNDLSTYGCLNGNIKLLTWNQFLELLAHTTTERNGIVVVSKR